MPRHLVRPPQTFKERRPNTDVAVMNETELSLAPSGTPDLEASAVSAPSLPAPPAEPRLGAPMLPNLPPVAPPLLDAAPALPLVSPVLSDDAPMLPTLPTLPSPQQLPDPSVGTPRVDLHVPPTLIDEVVAEAPGERRHPMAHLMPEMTKPSEAALRAAELRAAKRRKSKRNKIVGGVVLLSVAGAGGPPLASWTIDAINESGSTKKDEPTTSVPVTTLSAVDAMLTTPPTSAVDAASQP
jgi:hypothetical protein